MSEDSTDLDHFQENTNTETDEEKIGETSSINDSSHSHWTWLRRMWWEERKSKVDILQNKPQCTRKRKHSVVDPFLKRFSTRELQGLNETPLKNGSPVRLHNSQLSKSDSFPLKELDEEQGQCKLSNGSTLDRNTPGSFRSGILNPKGTFVYFWNYLLAFGIFYHLWTIIFRIAFMEGKGTSGGAIAFLVFDYIVDVIFILDILISSRISFLQNGILVGDVKRVAFTYLFTRAFYIDILSILPVDLFYIALGVTPALRLVRLIKVYKLLKIKTDVESMASFPALLRSSLLVHSMLLLIHWNASFYFMISQSEGFGTNAWVYPSLNGSFTSLTRKYARSFYWSTLTLTAIGDLPAPETNVEYLYTICCYLCGIFMFATVVGNIGSIILNRNSSKIMFEQNRDEARNYMEERKVPKALQERVLLWYDYAFQRGRINGVDDLNSLSLLPDKMKTELAIHIHLETLKKVSFLQKCQPEFLHDLLLKMKLIIYTPGDLIIRRGEIAREMYLISDGIVQIIGEAGDVLKELGTGDFFGEIGILNLSGGQNRRIADVRSVGYTECFMLLREDVLTATHDFPEAQAILSAYGRERLNSTRKTSTWREGLTTSVQDNGKRLPEFELQVVRESVCSVVHENEGFLNEESDEKVGNKRKSNDQQGTIQVNPTSLPQKSSLLSRISGSSYKERASQAEASHKLLVEELKKSIKLKEKEVSLLNDVIHELQREKDDQAREVDNLKNQIQNSCKKLQELENENSKLRYSNETTDNVIQDLRNEIEEYQRKGNEHDIFVAEVNECENSC